MTNSINPDFKVVVWGPPASGKESLVKILEDSLKGYQAARGLEFYIEEEKRIPPDSERTFYFLGRKRTNQINDPGINASVFGHTLEISTPAVTESLNVVDRDAHMLILALDPTQLQETESASQPLPVPVEEFDSSEEIDLSEFVRHSIFFYSDPHTFDKFASPASDGKLSRAEYAAQVRNGLEALRDDGWWYVEICITKIDKLPVDDRQRHPAQLLDRYFGDEMKTVLSKLKSERICLFSVPMLNTIKGVPAQSVDLGKPLLQLLQEYEMERFLHKGSKLQRIIFGTGNRINYIPYFKDNRS